MIFFTEVALSPNDHNVFIFKKSGNKWTKEATLTEVYISMKVVIYL